MGDLMHTSKTVIKDLMEKRPGKNLFIKIVSTHHLSEEELVKVNSEHEDGETKVSTHDIGDIIVPDDYSENNMKIQAIGITESDIYIPEAFMHCLYQIDLDRFAVSINGDHISIDTVIFQFPKRFNASDKDIYDVYFKIKNMHPDVTVIYCESSGPIKNSIRARLKSLSE